MPHNYSILIIALLLIFAVYRRVRRNIGFQMLVPRRLLIRSLIFIVIGILLIVAAVGHPIVYVSDAIGVALGLILAYFAIKSTRFERRKKGFAYRPNGWIGGIVIALFFARILYRLYFTYQMMNNPSTSGLNGTQTSAQMQASSIYTGDPWTAGIIFILFAYYPCYFLFLARKERHLEHDAGSPEPSN